MSAVKGSSLIHLESRKTDVPLSPKSEDNNNYTREMSYYENGFNRLGLAMMSLFIPKSNETRGTDLGVTLDSTNSITNVRSGSIAEQCGMYPSLKIYKIIDSNKKDQPIPSNGIIIIREAVTIRLTENSGTPLSGRVLINRKYILPDRPIIVPSGFRDSDERTTGVYGGVVKIRRDANSYGVRAGQVVQFSVRFDGNEFEAHLLLKKHKSSPFRRRFDPLLRNETNCHSEVKPYPIPSAERNQKICLCETTDGSCTNANNKSYGEHAEEKLLAHDNAHKLFSIPSPNPIKYIKQEETSYQICFKNTNNLGQTSDIIIKPSRVMHLRIVNISKRSTIRVPNYTAMRYVRNGETRPDFREIWFDGGRTIWLTDIDKKLTIPETDNVALVVGRIRDLANYCGVSHNISSYCNPLYTEELGLRSIFEEVNSSELERLRHRWGKTIVRSWAIRNRGQEYLYNITKHNMMVGSEEGTVLEVQGCHGTDEKNIISIASYGFDTSRRNVQAFGAGEYLANAIGVPSTYTKGGEFIFICDVLVKEKSAHYSSRDDNHDHTFIPECGYIIVKNRDGWVQAIPRYVVQFRTCGTNKNSRLRTVLANDSEDALLVDKSNAASRNNNENSSPSSDEEPGLSSTTVSEAESEVTSSDEHLRRFCENQTYSSDVGMFSSETTTLHVSGISSKEEVEQVCCLVQSKTGLRVTNLYYNDGSYSELYIETSGPIRLLNFASLNYFGGRGLEGTNSIIRFDDAAHGNDWGSWRLCKKTNCHGRKKLGISGCCRVHTNSVVQTRKFFFQEFDSTSAKHHDIVSKLSKVSTVSSCTAICYQPELLSKPSGEWKDLWCCVGTTRDDAVRVVREGFHFGSDRLSHEHCPTSKGRKLSICCNDCQYCSVISDNISQLQFSESCRLISSAVNPGDNVTLMRCRVLLPEKLISAEYQDWYHPAIKRIPNPNSQKISSLYVVSQPTDIIPLHIVSLTINLVKKKR